MTRKEAERLARQSATLQSLGFTSEEAEQLRRISMTLQRWHELECGDGYGYIERDETTGKCFYVNCNARYVDPKDPRARHSTADRETGAKKRLAAILKARNERGRVDHWQKSLYSVSAYIQTDPRGAALYILRPGDVPNGADVSAYYSRGICVY
jgi:hypothetical protein